MASQSGGDQGELEDVFAALEQIERDLRFFQTNIKPAVTRIGGGLERWSLNIGTGYQQAAENLYQQAQENGATQGAYSYQDLENLKTAVQLQQKAGRLVVIGRAAETAGRAAAWALDLYKQTTARKRILEVMAQEQERLPWLNDLIERGTQHMRRGQAREVRYLQELAGKTPQTRSQRVQLDRQMSQTVREARRLAEAESRLEYYREVSTRIERFRPEQFEAGMADLLAGGVELREVYQLRGMRYLDTIDEALCRLEWESPYYRNGLPEGIIYFLNEGAGDLPDGTRLEGVDRAYQRIREETPPFSRFGDWLRAQVYLLWQVGNPVLLWRGPYDPGLKLFGRRFNLKNCMGMLGMGLAGLLLLIGALALISN